MSFKMSMYKQCNVQNRSRTITKSVEAANLRDLIDKGCSALGIDRSKFRKLVLEKDGAGMDEYDEDCFPFLNSSSVLMFLSIGEEWQKKEILSEQENDATDTRTSPDRSLERLAEELRRDPDSVFSFTFRELKTIADCSSKDLETLLMDEELAVTVRHRCIETLYVMDDQLERDEWREIIKEFEELRSANEEERSKQDELNVLLANTRMSDDKGIHECQKCMLKIVGLKAYIKHYEDCTDICWPYIKKN